MNASCKKQELINDIGIYLKDYIWKICEEDDDDQLCIIVQNIVNGWEDNYEIYTHINDTWEKNKKRIELIIKSQIKECVICNETKELIFCDECLNEYCDLCEAQIIVKNKGIHICPFCRDGEELININNSYNNALKKHRYEEALKIIESKYD